MCLFWQANVTLSGNVWEFLALNAGTGLPRIILFNMILEMLKIAVWEGHKDIGIKKKILLFVVIYLKVPRKATPKLLEIVNYFRKIQPKETYIEQLYFPWWNTAAHS